MTPRDWDLWNSHSWSSPGLFLLTMWYPSPILACGDFRHTFTIMLISRHTWFWHGRSLELSSTICQLAPSKVPGPEGFTGEFYQTLHKFVEPNLLSVYNDIWQGGLYLPSGNQAIKILLSKKKRKDPPEPVSYRPISLLNLDVKILSKTVATRLITIIPTLIHP